MALLLLVLLLHAAGPATARRKAKLSSSLGSARSAVTVLSRSPRLELDDHFLSVEEVAAARALQFTRGEANATRLAAGRSRTVTYYDAMDSLDVVLLARVEQRVADWTGTPWKVRTPPPPPSPDRPPHLDGVHAVDGPTVQNKRMR